MFVRPRRHGRQAEAACVMRVAGTARVEVQVPETRPPGHQGVLLLACRALGRMGNKHKLVNETTNSNGFIARP